MTSYTVRLAAPADAEAGARLHLACWRESYAGLVAPERLAAVTSDEQRWVDAWREQLQPTNPRWLAVADDELIGFACAGPDRTENNLLGLEVYAIYVRQTWHGTGAGQTLLDVAVGDLACSVWVLEENPRAHAFYARNGFRPDGRRDYDDALAAWEVRLVR